MQTTIGQLLINDVLPADMQDYDRVLDKKGINALLRDVAQKHPDKYRDVSHRLSQIGWRASQESGGYSFGLEHMRKSKASLETRKKLQAQINGVLDNDSLSDKQREELVVRLVGNEMKSQQKTIYDEAMAAKNPLAYQVLSGSRGNQMNLSSLLGSDMLYTDHRDHVIPVPVLRSYSEGLSPAEYWAGTYGARRGVIATKMMTADAGFLCLAGQTMVRMADWSAKPIEQICVGDEVLGADREGRTFPVKVTAVFANGRRKLRRFRFRYGKSRTQFLSVVATAEHKALCHHIRRRYGDAVTTTASTGTVSTVPLGQFERRPESRHALIPPQGFFSDRGVDEPWAGLIGLLIAEGGLTTNHIGVSGGDPVLMQEAGRLADRHGFELRQRKGKAYEYTLIDRKPLTFDRDPDGRVVAGCFTNRMRQRLETLALLGKLASDKRMPVEVSTWSNRSIAELLQWLFAGDGCCAVSNNSTVPLVTLGMTSADVVYSAQRLLADRFGIYGQVHTNRTKGRLCGSRGQYQAKHDTYVLSISNRESVLRFYRDIGFVSGAKQQRLEKLLAKAGVSSRYDKFVFCFLTSEDAGEGETFDIEVDHPDHLFVLANGAIVSNSKQLNQVSHRLVVTDLDGDGEPDGIRGLPVDTDDNDNEGALLAVASGGYPRNTVLTPKILKDMQQRGLKRILVRSPIVGGSPDGGVYARDAGVREKGSLPGRGEVIGLAAAQALSEPISQGQLSAKHSGGVAGEEKAVSGFDYINSLVQTPKHIKGGAAHAEVDGIVTRIEEAPAGGKYVAINGERHYVNAGFNLNVKPGDQIEAGDVISEGVPNPAIVVKHKGIGEGRRYFVKAFKQAMDSAGMRSNRRNIELLSRGLINHVVLDEEMDDYNPEDVVAYSTVESRYKPRPQARSIPASAALNKYLEKPVLHYSIGTRLRPSTLKTLNEFGIKDVTIHDDPPPFQPEMIRGMYSLAHDPDWMTRMYGSGLKGSVIDSVHRGAKSDELGTSFVPSLAHSVDFGRVGKVIQPKPFKTAAVEGASLFTDNDIGPGANPAIKPAVPAAPVKPPVTSPATPSYGQMKGQGMGFAQQLAMQAAPHLGPIGPMMFALGLNPTAMSTLTRGPNKPAPAPQPPPPAVNPAPTQPVPWYDQQTPLESRDSMLRPISEVGSLADLAQGGRAAYRGAKAVATGVKPVARTASKLLPGVNAVVTSLEAANDVSNAWQAGRDKGHNWLTAIPAGFHYNSQDMLDQADNVSGPGHYAYTAANIGGRPLQALYSLGHSTVRNIDDIGFDGVRSRIYNDQQNTALQDAMQYNPRTMTVPDENQSWVSRLYSGQNRVLRPRTGAQGEPALVSL